MNIFNYIFKKKSKKKKMQVRELLIDGKLIGFISEEYIDEIVDILRSQRAKPGKSAVTEKPYL